MVHRRDKDVTTAEPQCYFCPEIASCGNCMISSLLNRITALEKKIEEHESDLRHYRTYDMTI